MDRNTEITLAWSTVVSSASPVQHHKLTRLTCGEPEVCGCRLLLEMHALHPEVSDVLCRAGCPLHVSVTVGAWKDDRRHEEKHGAVVSKAGPRRLIMHGHVLSVEPVVDAANQPYMWIKTSCGGLRVLIRSSGACGRACGGAYGRIDSDAPAVDDALWRCQRQVALELVW